MTTERLRVVIAAGIFYPDIGGPAIHARKIAEALAAAGYQVTVVAYGEASGTNPFSFRVKRVSRALPGLLRWFIYFLGVLSVSFKADVIYAFDPSAAGLPAFLVAKILKKRFLIRIGGDPIWERIVETGKRFLPLKEYYDEKFYLKDKPFLFKTIRWMLKRADQIVVYSQFFKDFYKQFYGVQPNKITIIKNPISKKETAQTFLGQEPIILFAGRFVAYKNLALVIEAFSAIRKRFSTGKLVLIGHGPGKESLEAKIQNLQLGNFVEIKPQMDQEKLFEEIRHASICIAPALTEFNPNFILESLSFGKPVLISRGNGLSVELPEDFLFNPQNEKELEQKLSIFFNPDFYKKAVEAVQKLPMEQTWEKVVATHLQLLEAMNPVRGRSPQGGRSRAFGGAASNGMKVLMISTDLQIFNEGTAVRGRIKEYGGLVEELHIIVFARRYLRQCSQLADNVWVYPTNSWSKLLFIFDACRIAKQLIVNRKLKIENWIVTTQDPFETSVVGTYLKNKFNIPLQIQVHTDFLSPYFWRQSMKNFIRRFWWGAKFLKKADGIRVVSQRIKISLLKKGIVDNKVVILPIFFEAMRFQNAVSNNQYQNDFLILTIARLEPEKNLLLAIKAVADAIHRQPDKKIWYIIIGSGQEEQKLRRLIKKLEMEDRIIIKRAATSDLPGWYKRADLFLLTSNYEGYGMVAAEAIAAGTPVVMSDVGLAGELVKNGENGLVFPVGNKEALKGILRKILSREIDLEKLKIGVDSFTNNWVNKTVYLELMRKSWESLLR